MDAILINKATDTVNHNILVIKKMKLTEQENIQRQGSEQQASKSVCQSSRWYEPPVDSRSFSETDDLVETRQMKHQTQFNISNI